MDMDMDMNIDMGMDINMDMDMDMDMDIDMQCVQSQNSPIMVPKWSQNIILLIYYIFPNILYFPMYNIIPIY